ncbi:Protein of unknown function (DUF982) [Rhizobium leguminosarum bv. viciae WSM1455]|nr:Protein of unknown function (DUF982) [Rhizobium leguminosarum bv. viciae WSM1455]
MPPHIIISTHAGWGRGLASRKIAWTLGDTARLLINAWPCGDGEEYVVAIKASVDALSGKIASEQFPESLLRAANEAGIARSFARPAGSWRATTESASSVQR